MIEERETNQKFNGTIDIVKFLLAILVIGIHTEPFGFNFWLDKGFGIVTRLCVPFFFVTSAYFFWTKKKSALKFLSRIGLLYTVWSIIYLPYDISAFKETNISQILIRFLCSGNEHALWYLCGTIWGFIITCILLKILKPKYVLIVAIILLVIGTIKSTYSTAFEHYFGYLLPDYLGSRNGLFYSFPYIALGMSIAKSKEQGKTNKKMNLYIGFVVSLFLLMFESYIFVIRFKAESTILWLSVFPCTYYFFMIANNVDFQINKTCSLTFRKMSTLLYVSQYLFIPIFSGQLTTILLFLAVSVTTSVFSLIIIKLSAYKPLFFLKYLY